MTELKPDSVDGFEPAMPGSYGRAPRAYRLPEGTRLISVMRQGRSELAEDSTVIRPGDQVLAVLEPGKEDELRRVLLKK